MPRNSGVNRNVSSQVNTSNGESWTVNWSYSFGTIHCGTMGAIERRMGTSTSTLSRDDGERIKVNEQMAKVSEMMMDIKYRALIVRVMLWSWVAFLVCLGLEPSLFLVGATVVVPPMLVMIKYYFATQQRPKKGLDT